MKFFTGWGSGKSSNIKCINNEHFHNSGVEDIEKSEIKVLILFTGRCLVVLRSFENWIYNCWSFSQVRDCEHFERIVFIKFFTGRSHENIYKFWSFTQGRLRIFWEKWTNKYWSSSQVGGRKNRRWIECVNYDLWLLQTGTKSVGK